MVNRRKLFGLIVLSFICSLLYMIFINSYIIQLGIFFSCYFLIMLTVYFFALFGALYGIIKKVQLKFNIYFFLFLLFALIAFSSFFIGVKFKILITIIIVEVSSVLAIIFGILGMIEEKKK